MTTVTVAMYNGAGSNGNGHGLYNMNSTSGHAQMFSASSTSSSSSSLSSMYQSQSTGNGTPSDTDSGSVVEDGISEFPAIFCRAKYDYVAQDSSALSFQTGDIIEVLTQQPSGWWDGLLNDERGWFPSNYVTMISEEEAEREFEERYGSQGQPGLGAQNGNRQSVVDMGQALMGSSSTEDPEQWLTNALENESYAAAPAPNVGSQSSASDFWMPQVASNGQIFYVNTKTGEQSRDLPQESEDDISSDSDLAGLALNQSSTSRAFPGDNLNHLGQLGNIASHLSFGLGDPTPQIDPSASVFGIQKRTGTPEPWIRRLADDGLSYYYLNKLDGTVQWTRPESAQPQTPTTAVPRVAASSSAIRPISVYSDTSDVHPSESSSRQHQYGRTHGHAQSSSVTTATANKNSSQPTSAEIIAHSLQQSLLPPPPESPLEMAAVARNAIRRIVNRLRLDGSTNGLADGETDDIDKRALLAMEGMDGLIDGIVNSVRNLLYVSAVPTSSIPSSVLPKGYVPPKYLSSSHHSSSSRSHDRSHSHSHHHPNASLKPAQRKVTATLSRLVLSARAITYDAGSVSPSHTAERISGDAEELERAVEAFVAEVQKLMKNQQSNPKDAASSQLGRKRLTGVFDTQNLGLGLAGAGMGGIWKGFGWVSVPEDEETSDNSNSTLKLPSKPLSPDVITEVAGAIARLDTLLSTLVLAVQSPDTDTTASNTGEVHPVLIHSYAKDVVNQVHTMLKLIADIDIAESVVIDTPPPANSSTTTTMTDLSDSTLSSISSSSSSLSLHDSSSSSISTSTVLSNGSIGTTVVSNGHSDAYNHALLVARTVLRSFEAAVQSIFDDASSLFGQTQILRNDPLSSFASSSSSLSPSPLPSLRHERELVLDVLNVLCTSLKANSAVVLQMMERLLTVGAEQKEVVGMKEWEGSVRYSREVSRRSMVRASMIGAARPTSMLQRTAPAPAALNKTSMYGYDVGIPSALQPGYGISSPMVSLDSIGSLDGGALGGAPDDELGLEDAFARPQRPIRIEPNRYQGPQSPDSYGVPAPQIQQKAQLPQSSSSTSLSQRPVKLLPSITQNMMNNATPIKQVEGYNQRNGMGYTGTGNIVGDTYQDLGQPGYGSESEREIGSYSGMTSSASEGEEGYDIGEEDDEEFGLGDMIDDDPLTPRARARTSKPKTNNKAAKILGDEAPPWFLLPNEGAPEKDIVFDSDKSVKGGTVAALVEKLTAHDTTDPNYSKAFLMTFKSFTTLNELFDVLVERFRIQPPAGLGGMELKQWTSKKKNIVQFRVINTFKSMLNDEDILEKEDLYILDRMKEFVLSDDVALVSASRSLLPLIERAQKSGETKRIVVKAAQTAPAPIVPKGISLSSAGFGSNASKKLKLTDIDPLELARQLTLFESSLYQKIRPMECLQRAREGSKGDGGNMDNIAFVIQTSNRIADWVAESVLTKEDSRKRAAAVKHLILVADRCRTLNNFSTMIAIVSGLNTPPIRRLKRTWEQVSQRHMAQFGACEVTLDSNRNFNKYRSMLASVVPPCVPFIGVFLSTLQFIQDGNKDLLPGGMINFKKRQMASEVINDIKRWQSHSYNLQIVPIIREYIEESLSAFDDTRMSSDRFWQMSLDREPREREDEKMARLLQESGFL